MSGSLQATRGPYCGEGCPALGMWDLDRAWCDVFESKMEIEQGVGTLRCSKCMALNTQETWYPVFSQWRKAIRRQDNEDEAAGKKPGKYLRKENRDRGAERTAEAGGESCRARAPQQGPRQET